MLGSLFPSGVATAVRSPIQTRSTDILHPEEEDCVRHALPRRRAEFVAGRACAREAMARLGIEAAPLPAGADRTPQWPPGVIGSISHTEGYCAAAVARVGEIIGIGLDVESAEPLARGVAESVCTPTERARSRRLFAPGWSDWGKLIFSAKESTYKCYYPLARELLDFPDLEIELRPQTGSFVATLVRESAASARGVRRFAGRFVRSADYVITAVTLTADQIGKDGSPCLGSD